jgi:transposase
MDKKLAKNFVGVDVSKNSLDVYIYPAAKKLHIENNEIGIASLISELAKYQIERIACEASGGYEYQMFHALKRHGFCIWKIQPKRIKGFIESEGINLKTDASDAKMIALFIAQKDQLKPQITLSADALALQAMVKRKDDLTKMVSAEKARLKQSHDAFCQCNIKKSIDFIEKQIEELSQKIADMIDKNDDWREKSELVQTVPGVGTVTAALMVAEFPELGTIGGKQAAALVGLAPYARQSGNYKGYSFIRGGRATVRRIVYMAALTASRSNEVLRVFYQRLIAAGKKPKVALIAVARKIVTILNAMVRDKKVWSYV